MAESSDEIYPDFIREGLREVTLRYSGPPETIAHHGAVQLAKSTGAKIHILNVVEELSTDAKLTLQAYFMDGASRSNALHERTHQAKGYLKDRVEKFWSEQAEEDRHVRDQIATVTACEAYPAEQILKSAIEHDCDLVVMGAHEKGLSHNFLGGVAKSVLRRSRIPTLIVPLP